MMYQYPNPFIQCLMNQSLQSTRCFRTLNEYNNSFNFIHIPLVETKSYSLMPNVLTSLNNDLSLAIMQLKYWNSQITGVNPCVVPQMNYLPSSLNYNCSTNSTVNENCKYNSEKDSSQASTEERSLDVVALFKEFYPVRQVGKYDWRNRIMKIIKYKLKKIRKETNKPVITKYMGRSKVATLKARYKGRFIKAKDLDVRPS